MKEITVEDYLVEQVEARGGFCPKTIWPGRRGCPDREVVWPWGGIDKVETKRPKGGRYEAGQLQAHKEYAKRGVPVYLLREKAQIDVYVQARALRVHLPALHSLALPLTPEQQKVEVIADCRAGRTLRSCYCTDMDCVRCYPELNA